MKKIKFFFFFFFILLVSVLVFSFYPILNFSKKTEQLPASILIYDRAGDLITDKGNQNGYFKSYKEEIPLDSSFIKSLLKIEDKNFFEHYGVSVPSKFRALKNNFLNGEVASGGSTITEQWLKNKYFLGQKRSYTQKLRESVLAFYFSIFYSKERILKNYLDSLYFGNQIYGLAAAIENYFGKEEIESLGEEEIVLLLSLLHHPSLDSLYEKNFRTYYEKTKKRLGFDYDETYKNLKNKKNLDLFPFVTNKILEKTDLKFYQKSPYGIELKITSSLDKDLQNFVKETLNNEILKLSKNNVTNGAVYILNPKTDEELVYLGSRDFFAKDLDGQVDVISSKRQMGSTLKPFLYLKAIEEGAGLDSFLLDIESEYNSFQEGKTYISENYSLKEYGLVRLKKSLGNSLNNSSVRLARDLGLGQIYDFYLKNGFELNKNSEHYGYGLVLGNPSLSLKNLVHSYKNLIPYGDPDKFLLQKALENPDNRDRSFGVNSILNTSIPQAVKTGTSSDFRDNVIISYSEDLIIGIWIGNNDNSSMLGVTGITGAGRVWHDASEKAIELGYIKNKKEEIPEGIEKFYYCLDEKCFRKEISYRKKGKKYYSKIADEFYSKKDIFGDLTSYEQKRLSDLGFLIKN